MKHFPLYLKVTDKRICLIGNDDDAVAKARLVAKSEAEIEIYSPMPEKGLAHYLAENGDSVTHYRRAFGHDDMTDSARPAIAFVYLTDADEDVMALLQAAHIPYCVIDNLAQSSFITPAIIDRAPVVIAVGTEGTAPVLARRLKKDLEDRLPQSFGSLARVAGTLRDKISAVLSPLERRHFWSRYFDAAHDKMTDKGAHAHADALLKEMANGQNKGAKNTPFVWFVSAGPGCPDLLTMQARRILHEADVILHDRLVPPPILELCRREAEVIEVGKSGFGPSWRQDDINALLAQKAKAGLSVVRLKSGDAGVFGRLDEEIASLDEKQIGFKIAPGLTSATAGAASMGASLTKRGRNTGYRMITGHDVNGYADHDWREMAKALRQNSMTASVYMSVRAAPYLAGRLLMHGAPHALPVTVAENISRDKEGWLVTTLGTLAQDIKRAEISGPAIIYLGLVPHQARAADLSQIPLMTEEEQAHVSQHA